ncbi:MAG: gas vesicle protein [Alphaproteobacteria bacterium]
MGPALNGDPASRVALIDLVDRLLDQGVVINGDLTLSLADVDLVYLGLRVLLCTPDRRDGIAG